MRLNSCSICSYASTGNTVFFHSAFQLVCVEKFQFIVQEIQLFDTIFLQILQRVSGFICLVRYSDIKEMLKSDSFIVTPP